MDESSTTTLDDNQANKPSEKRKISTKELDTVVNYMVLDFGYSCSLCLPYAEGAAIIAALKNAERVQKYYSSDGIKFLKESLEIAIHTVSQQEYRERKMKHLLELDQ